MSSLHTTWRPKDLVEVIGQETIVKSLQALIATPNRPQAYLFLGPSGSGKTTLARILAKEFGCDAAGIIEVDAATSGSVDAIRELVDQMSYTSLTGGSKMAIIDEVHVLSKQSWSALLKGTEEPAPNSYYCLCTTEQVKVPDANKTRLATYTLKPVSAAVLAEYLAIIAEAEGITLDSDTLEAIAEKSSGSVRQALVYLAQCQQADSLEAIRDILKAPNFEQGEVIDLARLISGGSRQWGAYQSLIGAIPSSDIGSVRPVLMKYLSRVVQGAKNSTEFAEKVKLLDAVEQMPYSIPEAEALAQLQLLVGRLLLN